ncbi:M20 family dipeptidase [Streptomyces piniterrae]|uniref:M20 family dipeptidase n=1 Tax=Streptomyces piniterrae TaxID=2571125 RepID=A0A4U0NIK9_9ACTN|nr:M20/M25/M40 family metallo-hydrolase [Streptomyces piniterrae]TJZ54099.1 M20 family dipeptidase [Streptomyces piniterrae]
MGTPAPLAAALRYAHRHRARFLDDVVELAAIPSVSTQPAHRSDVRRAARLLARRLRRAGLQDARVVATGGHPVVTAGWGNRPGRPTLLIYGHYDVQPAEPLAAWSSPPFRPTRRGDLLVGRGVSDNKGQLLTHVAAVESWLASVGRLPVNVRCVFEGEEEAGSPHLPAFLDRHWARWQPDVAVVSDTRMRDATTPALTVSLRGSLNLELTVNGATTHVHSGTYGGALADPARELCRIVAGLHLADGTPLPQLRWGTRALTESARRVSARSGPSDNELLALARAHRPGPGTVEPGWSAYERTTIRPACVITGLQAGYTGPGRQSIVPSSATARINVRLAPFQDPAVVEEALRQHLRATARAGVRVRLRRLSAAPPVELPTRGPAVEAAVAALRQGFGRRPVLLRSGGTIPVVAELARRRDLPVVLMGFALPDDRMHAPGERLSISCFHRGTRTAVAFLHELGARFPG